MYVPIFIYRLQKKLILQNRQNPQFSKISKTLAPHLDVTTPITYGIVTIFIPPLNIPSLLL